MDADSLHALDPATVAIAAGRGPRSPGSPLNPPVTFASVLHAGVEADYGREVNATWTALEAAIGALEGGRALTFASGMAAISAVLDTVPVGGVVVAPRDAYTGTRGQLGALQAQGRLQARLVDVADTDAVLAACAGADLLWVESPTNPLLAVADLPALAEGAGVPMAVDNTFATPLLQRPLDLGAAVAVHSATKFLAGHSDVVLGAAVTRDDGWLEALAGRRVRGGAIPGPMEAWLALRGLRTLPVRLERAQANALALAERLADDARVTRVRYPGLPSDPGHARAAAQMRGGGAMLSFEVAGDGATADAVCEAVRLITYATSLGGVETTMERRTRHPGEDHTPEALIRVSVGCEALEDLWADLDQALAAAAGGPGRT